MEYQKIINLSGDTKINHLSLEQEWRINEESQGSYSCIRSSLCDYSVVYIHVKATITVPNTAAAVYL